MLAWPAVPSGFPSTSSFRILPSPLQYSRLNFFEKFGGPGGAFNFSLDQEGTRGSASLLRSISYLVRRLFLFIPYRWLKRWTLREEIFLYASKSAKRIEFNIHISRKSNFNQMSLQQITSTFDHSCSVNPRARWKNYFENFKKRKVETITRV